MAVGGAACCPGAGGGLTGVAGGFGVGAGPWGGAVVGVGLGVGVSTATAVTGDIDPGTGS